MSQQLTLPSTQQDFVDWRKGRRYFAVWAIALDLPVLQQASADLRAALGDLALPGYSRQPHLTLHLSGFPTFSPMLADDFGPAQFTAQREALIKAAPQAFDLELGAIDSYTSAPYFSVTAGLEPIQQLRQSLAMATPGIDHLTATPHVTIGLYQQAQPLAEVISGLNACYVTGPIRTVVSQIDWMVYEAALIGGPLISVATFDLLTRRCTMLRQDIVEGFLGG